METKKEEKTIEINVTGIFDSLDSLSEESREFFMTRIDREIEVFNSSLIENIKVYKYIDTVVEDIIRSKKRERNERMYFNNDSHLFKTNLQERLSKYNIQVQFIRGSDEDGYPDYYAMITKPSISTISPATNWKLK